MGDDITIRPVGAPVATPVIRAATDATRDAVPTQLPSDKSVSAAAPLPHAHVSVANSQQADSDRIAKTVKIDRAAASVVYVAVDETTHQVVDQYPEESRLRMRAYLRTMDTARQDSQLQSRRIETDHSV